MTIIDPTARPSADPTSGPASLPFEQVALDLYRDIHKAIRTELFAVTTDAGRLDPSDGAGRASLAAHVSDVARFLIEHAEHEDSAIAPVLHRELPDLAASIDADHQVLECRIEGLRDQAAGVAAPSLTEPRSALHRLYVDLASFTSAYLAHQDLEERVVMPALQLAVGVDAVVAIHGSIVGPMPPEELARSLALMLPAINLDDLTDFFQGFAAGAPAPVVDEVWSLATSVLEPADVDALARRIGR
jgi:hypothetical protein